MLAKSDESCVRVGSEDVRADKTDIRYDGLGGFDFRKLGEGLCTWNVTVRGGGEVAESERGTCDDDLWRLGS